MLPEIPRSRRFAISQFRNLVRFVNQNLRKPSVCASGSVSTRNDLERRRKPVFFQIRPRADAVYDGEEARGGEGGQHSVPGSPVVVYGLTGADDERQWPAGRSFIVGGHGDEEGLPGHRHEALAAVGVPLHEVKPVGQGAWHGVEQADARPAVPEIEPGAVVIAPAETFVDDPVRRSGGIEKVAERREGPGADRLGDDAGHASRSMSLSSPMRTTCSQASRNSVS